MLVIDSDEMSRKMKRFYLSGQNNFGNRGCEALVRSTLEALRAEFGEVEVLVPSYRIDLDSKQWPDADKLGCRFVRAAPYPIELKIWGRARRLFPWLKNRSLPNYKLPADIRRDLASCDALLVIGGDNLTLDYGFESLIWHIRFAQHAKLLGKKVMVWGASIGPFSEDSVAERFVAEFLNSIDGITVRETISKTYLESIGVSRNVSLVADGAFLMTPEPIDVSGFWPAGGGDVLGFNISPVIQAFRPKGEPESILQNEVAGFLREVVKGGKESVLLIPHVDPLDGAPGNSDTDYMRRILELVGDCEGRISLMPSNLNAAQIKFVLSKCSRFIGGRTHATIGALSCNVPTVSIAYSTKAKGINKDLFGNEDLVLSSADVSAKSLKNFHDLLTLHQDSIRSLLGERIPEWKNNARLSARIVANILRAV